MNFPANLLKGGSLSLGGGRRLTRSEITAADETGLTLDDRTHLPAGSLRVSGPLFGWVLIRGETAGGAVHRLFAREVRRSPGEAA